VTPTILPRIIAVLIAAVAAILAPVSTPASAAPAAAIDCWSTFSTSKSGQTITATAYKDCAHLDVPQNLSLALEMQVCDPIGCNWVTWKTGVGTVTYTCPGTFYAPMRSSRLRDKIVYCTYY
jgi:zona occludens toxin (predicted ATPase)